MKPALLPSVMTIRATHEEIERTGGIDQKDREECAAELLRAAGFVPLEYFIRSLETEPPKPEAAFIDGFYFALCVMQFLREHYPASYFESNHKTKT